MSRFTKVTDTIGDTGAFDSRVLFGDFNGDAAVDILYQNGNVAGQGIGLKLNNGDGTFTDFPDASFGGTPFAGFSFAGVHISTGSPMLFVVDIDHDGDLDLVDRTVGPGTQSIWRYDAGSYFKDSDTIGDTGAFDTRVLFGDFNGDGAVDILYQDGNTAGQGIGVMLNTGFRYFFVYSDASAAGSPFAGIDFSGVQISGAPVLFALDIDNDGDIDIVDRTIGTNTQSILRNDNGAFSKVEDTIGDTGAFDTRMVFGDFDSDGDIDILYQNGNTAGVGIGYKQNLGNGTFLDFVDASAGSTPFQGYDFTGMQISTSVGPFAVDIDNDGDIDLVDRTVGSNTQSIIKQGGFGDVNAAPPKLVSSSPADNAGAFDPKGDIVLTFNESVTLGGGVIEIHRASDGAVVASTANGTAQLSGSGTTWSLNPTTDLAGLTNYYVTFGEKAFVDADGMTFGVLQGLERNGITSPTFLNFTTDSANSDPTANVDSFTILEDSGATVLDVLANDSTAPDVGETLTVTNVTQPASGGSVFLSGGVVIFTPSPNFNGPASFTYTISDGNGGFATAGATVNVQAVNDAPSFNNGANITVLEDSGAFSAGWATGISAGPANESGQPLSFTTTNSNNALFSVQPSIDATGRLTFTPAADANGVTIVTVVLKDNGGTANGGLDTSSIHTFTITVNAANDAPTGLGDLTLPSILEDAASPAGAAITNMSGFNFLDVDAGSSLAGVAVVANAASATTEGAWQYSTDSGSHWHAVGAVSNSSSLVLSSTAQLRFVPVADYSGAPPSLTVRAIDDSYAGALSSGGELATRVTINALTNGGGTAISADTNTIGVNVIAVNDAPTATGLDNTVTTLEDSGAIALFGAVSVSDVDDTVVTATLFLSDASAGFLTGSSLISVGGGVYTISGTPTSIQAALADVAFTPALNFNGSLTVDVAISDGTRDPGLVYPSGQVSITVTPQNDAPTDVELTGGLVAENAANGTVVGSLSTADIDVGDTAGYALLDDAGGRFAIGTGLNAGKIVVANGLLLDYEQASSYQVTVQVTDSGGATFDKVLTIGLTDVNPETVVGDAGNNVMFGGSGADLLDGGSGADTLDGGLGSDTLIGGEGADRMIGGDGDETYYVENAGDVVVEAANGGVDRVKASIDYTLTDNVENLTLVGTATSGAGNGLANLIIGTNGANVLNGLVGADTMIGYGGDDVYFVDNAGDVVIETLNGGSDEVRSSISYTLAANVEKLTLVGTAITGVGNALANTIVGNTTLNILDGGLGNDTLTGGAGIDRFLFSTTLGVNNVDTITDFSHVDDTIRIDDAVFAGLTVGNLAANAFRSGAGLTTAQGLADRIIYNTTSGDLFFDRDGSGSLFGAVKFATLTGHPNDVAANDFVVV